MYEGCMCISIEDGLVFSIMNKKEPTKLILQKYTTH